MSSPRLDPGLNKLNIKVRGQVRKSEYGFVIRLTDFIICENIKLVTKENVLFF